MSAPVAMHGRGGVDDRMPDAALVLRTIAGESDAFAEIVRRYQQPLHRHLRGMGLDHDTSIDLVQDAFVKAYTRIGECREPEYFRAWLFSIGRNLCLDYLKNVRRQMVPLSDLPGGECFAVQAAPDASVHAVRDALDVLPPLLREAFLLKHDAGYTYDEIAGITGVSVSAVKMRVHRAREVLRAALQDLAVEVTIRRPSIVLNGEEDRRSAPATRRGGPPAQLDAEGTSPVSRSRP